MNTTAISLRYSQFFILCLLGIFLYTATQSLAGGISNFATNLWGRRSLITLFTSVRLKLGDRVYLQAVVGKEGWLEFTGDRSLDGYQNVIGTRPNELKNTQRKIQKLYEELRKRNITLILVIPPDKATIYPDKFDELEKLNTQSKLDAFAAYMQKYGPHVLVDVRATLRNERKYHDVYRKTDTHWNSFGAFVSYTQIMRELAKTYPQLAPMSITDFKTTTGQPFLQDIANIMGATNLLEANTALVPKNGYRLRIIASNVNHIPLEITTTENDILPTLLMYRDSFGGGLRKFIAPHFSKATYIVNTSKNPRAISLKTIDLIKPDIVIVEVAERLFNVQVLDNVLNDLLAWQK
jgi:alginate O-acetyltransferase complex protein AlgJ